MSNLESIVQSGNYALNDRTGCWEWKKSLRNGYAQTWDGQNVLYGHRVFYEHFRGPIPAGHDLHHLCENRRCVNPDHLQPQPHDDHPRVGRPSKLTWEQVGEIRSALEVSNREFARRFGVAACTVCNIRAGRGWPEEKRP